MISKTNPLFFRTGLLLPSVLGATLVASVSAADPSWWRQDDTAIISSGAADNFAVANIGQAKAVAHNALAALRKVIPSLADAVEADLVGTGKPIPAWTVPTTGSDLAAAQYAALTLGQLKAIAAPFYEHLHSYAPAWLDLTLQANSTYTSGSYFPWTTATTDDANFALATIGQLKAVFALDFAADLEYGSKGDGISDLWEYGVVHADGGVTYTSIDQINIRNALAIGLTSPAGPAPHVLSLHANAQVDSRLPATPITTTGKTSLDVFEDYDTNDSLGIFKRNANFWGSDMAQDLTCISPFNSDEGNGKAGTAITPRHIIFAAHYVIANNAYVTFVTASHPEVVVTRRLLASAPVPNPDFPDPASSSHFTDLQIGILDSDLPASITPCKILPADITRYLSPELQDYRLNTPTVPGVFGAYPGPGIPTLELNQHEQGSTEELATLFNQYQSRGFGLMYPDVTLSPLHAQYHVNTQGGDSGDPIFVIVNNKPVLAATQSLQGGPLICGYEASVNATIAALDTANGFTGPHYTVQEADFSEFLKLR